MKRLLKKVETLMAAATFAEAGDHETAREIMKEEKRSDKRDAARPTQRPGPDSGPRKEEIGFVIKRPCFRKGLFHCLESFRCLELIYAKTWFCAYCIATS